MNRSDFLSAMAAVFCGVLLPIPERETIGYIRIASNGEIRHYARIALDHPIHGCGAYEDLANKIFSELWDRWCEMEVRHVL